MLNIFKYFFGIIGVLILVYVLIVVLRTVLVTGFTSGKEAINDPNVKQNVASGTVSLTQSISNFTLSGLSAWLLSARPLTVSPIYVGYDQENAGYSFFGNNENKGYKTQQQLYWQNLNNAPNAHPTDWVPVGKSYTQVLLDSQNAGDPSQYDQNQNQEEIKPSSEYIRANVTVGQEVLHNSVITGKAYYKVFSQRVFPIYIIDENGTVKGMFKAFANSDIGRDEMVDFRAVVKLPPEMPRNSYFKGSLFLTNDNTELSQIKAENKIPVIFAK